MTCNLNESAIGYVQFLVNARYTPVSLLIFHEEAHRPGRDDLVVSVSNSHAVGRGFASRLSHTKDHCKNCISAWRACLMVGV